MKRPQGYARGLARRCSSHRRLVRMASASFATPVSIGAARLTARFVMPRRIELMIPLKLRVVVIAVGLVTTAAGCNDITALSAPPRDASPLQTDSVSYKLVRTPHEFSAVVTGTFRNTTEAPIYFKRCMPRDSTPMFRLGRTGPDSTRPFFVDWAWACVGGVSTGVLQPGQSVTIRARVGSVDQPSMQPPLRPHELVGLLRIRLSLCARFVEDSDYCDELPHPHGRSNAFLVHY